MVRRLVFVLLVAAVTLHGQTAPQFYVSATGASWGNGSLSNPWDLKTALAQPAAVVPGSTIWLRAGTYLGYFTSNLTGTAQSPILVRNYQGERVTLDNKTDCSGFVINGAYTWYWGLELTSSGTKRRTPYAGSDCGDSIDVHLDRGLGFRVNGTGIRLINNVIHDTQNGIANWGTWTSGPWLEAYGNLIYGNGWEQCGSSARGTDGKLACLAPGPTDRGHGHGIYTLSKQNGPTSLLENISILNFSQGIRVGDEGVFEPLVEGNISALNGEHITPMGGRNFYIGGGNNWDNDRPNYVPMTNAVIRGNVSYYRTYEGAASPGNAGASEGMNAGLWWPGASGAIVNNYLAGLTGGHVLQLGYWDSFTATSCTGNTLIGSTAPYVATQCAASANVYSASKPTSNRVFVRPNKYEPGRGHIAIFNWQNLPSVAADLSPLGLKDGQTFKVRDAMNFYGQPVMTGQYLPLAPSVNLPMQGLVRAPMAGEADVTPAYVPKPHSAPEFAAFIVVPGAVKATPPVSVCISDPLLVTVTAWPLSSEGDRWLRWTATVNGAAVTIVSVLQVWSPSQQATFTDSRACSVTVKR